MNPPIPVGRRKHRPDGTGWRRAALIICMLALAMAVSARAQPPTAGDLRVGRPGRASITSADRRFMVSGMSSAENMVLANQLAELATRVEDKTGLPLPMRSGQVLGVMVQSATSPDMQILRMQGWDGGRFYQRLVVPGRFRLDGEDVWEGVCWLLLNRYAAEYTPAAQQAGAGAMFPEWISAGLAQNTQAALRSRNRDWIVRELAEGRSIRLANLIRLESLPPGHWREKAYAATAIEFLFPDGDSAVWEALFRAVGRRQPVDAAWLRRTAPALADRNPEAAWREYIEGLARARTIESWSDRGLQLEEQLLHILNIRPRDLVAGVSPDVPEDLFARDLIVYRNEEWVAALASALSLHLQTLRLGAPPPLQEVLALYTAYFEQFHLPPPEKTAWWRRPARDAAAPRPPDDATWQIALNQLWMRAERAHQSFLEQTQSRKRYVDAFDRPDTGLSEEAPPSLDDLPRTRWQRVLDDIELQMNSGYF